MWFFSNFMGIDVSKQREREREIRILVDGRSIRIDRIILFHPHHMLCPVFHWNSVSLVLIAFQTAIDSFSQDERSTYEILRACVRLSEWTYFIIPDQKSPTHTFMNANVSIVHKIGCPLDLVIVVRILFMSLGAKKEEESPMVTCDMSQTFLSSPIACASVWFDTNVIHFIRVITIISMIAFCIPQITLFHSSFDRI